MHAACSAPVAACQTALLECCTKPCSLNRNRLQHEVTPDNKLPNQHLKAFRTCCSQIFQDGNRDKYSDVEERAKQKQLYIFW